MRIKKVICGCDKKTQMRSIIYKQVMPMIIHDSDVDCLYQIDLSTETRNSLKLKITGFPEIYEACRGFVQISQAMNATDLVGKRQAYFDSMDTIRRFD